MVGVAPVAIEHGDDLGARAIRRVRRRLIPFLALLYFVAYLDRVNVGFAALQMNGALGLSPLDYGRGAGIFFLGYFLFEVPSNLALARVGARVCIARIAIVWGLVSMAMVFAVGPASFALLRFLLGAAEAGFFTGVVWTAVPFLAAAVGIVIVAAHSDRTGERRWHVAACGAVAAAGLAVSATIASPIGAFATLACAAIDLYAFIPPFWSLPTAFLRGDGAAAGIGLINSVGNLGGFTGPYVIGWMQSLSGDFRGLGVLAASALCSAFLVLTVRRTA